MKALVGAFNQEKALVGAFSVIVQPVEEPMEHYTTLILTLCRLIELEKAVVEGAGATGLAAVMAGLLPELKDKK